MDNLIGTVIDNFKIIELIGRGGMASVYLAVDKQLERTVALKIPNAKFMENRDSVKRFSREAKAMARLRHPNIVQIYSIGDHEGIPFIAMEYVRGKSLANIIKRNGPFEIEVALSYISQIANALEYAHKMDIVHRDIKPENILVDSSGRLLITDFGISKLLSLHTSQETLGFVGTPQYMSPEQCGEGVLDHRSDIYSLGTVFFELLTGKPPFAGNSPAETIKKQLFDMPEFPEEFQNKIPERIRVIISKMLAKEPEQRYSDIGTFLKEIEDFDRECSEPTITDPSNEIAHRQGVQNPQEFISRINGRRTRWPAILSASLACACIIAFSTSFILGNGTNLHAAATKILSSNKVIPAVISSEEPPQAVANASGPQIESAEKTLPEKIRIPEIAPILRAKSEATAAEGRIVAGVQIDSNPRGAGVSLDSQPRGMTPLSLTELPEGKHMLAMTLEGYPDYSTEISAESADTTKVFHDFEAAKEALIPKGSLFIDSDPTGAVVWIDGQKKGKTPLEISELLTGPYKVDLKLKDYEDMHKEITLQPDETLRISLNLTEKPKFGALNIGSQPDAAEVLVNGVYKGTTPLLIRQMPVGNYEVVLRKEGYESIRKKLVCKNDDTARFHATMRMTPEFAGLQSANIGDRCMEAADFAGAVAAYEKAVALDPNAPTYREKLGHARESLIVRKVQGSLTIFKTAYEQEDLNLLASVLDSSASDFTIKQISNAEKLFRDFGDMTVTLSDVHINIRHDGEVLVSAHLNIGATFAETGASIVLLDSDRTFLLRKTEDNWKICSME